MSHVWRDDAPANLVKLWVGRALASNMTESMWSELGLMTDTSTKINGHPRLLRSLRFHDEDYEGHVFDFVSSILGETPQKARHDWDPTPVPPPQPLQQRFRYLTMVTEYLGVPAFVAQADPSAFGQLFKPSSEMAAADATLPDGTLLTAAESATARLEVGEMRRQIDRIRRDYADDPEAAVGQAKELVESACKTILGMTGDLPGGKEDVPRLVTRTLRHLGIDPSQLEADSAGPAQALLDPVQVRAGKRVLGGVSSILNGTDELRNVRGTGHGRSGSVMVDAALARMTVSVALAAVTYLIEVYEARTGPGEAPILVPADAIRDLRIGDRVLHTTFGAGVIAGLEGLGDKQVITVDFADGPRRLLRRYAPLTLL